ncbi:hypothetical protein CSUI_010345 [Cystoisospora suis]|uniref:Uncharacterized protein n=1 Tax=Cystoisospora suis TaxID=483139 RepID=A0A2C6JBW8_9APIC|nr:hypothetical protein CSUI_010345 [Cystoisospora suis]
MLSGRYSLQVQGGPEKNLDSWTIRPMAMSLPRLKRRQNAWADGVACFRDRLSVGRQSLNMIESRRPRNPAAILWETRQMGRQPVGRFCGSSLCPAVHLLH